VRSSRKAARVGMSICIDVAVFLCGAVTCNVPTVAGNTAGVLGNVGISIGIRGSHYERENSAVGSENNFLMYVIRSDRCIIM
jgi:hypothetical protein